MFGTMVYFSCNIKQRQTTTGIPGWHRFFSSLALQLCQAVLLRLPELAQQVAPNAKDFLVEVWKGMDVGSSNILDRCTHNLIRYSYAQKHPTAIIILACVCVCFEELYDVVARGCAQTLLRPVSPSDVSFFIHWRFVAGDTAVPEHQTHRDAPKKEDGPYWEGSFVNLMGDADGVGTSILRLSTRSDRALGATGHVDRVGWNRWCCTRDLCCGGWRRRKWVSRRRSTGSSTVVQASYFVPFRSEK